MGENNTLMELHLIDYSAVNRFRSVRRAIRHGNVTVSGVLVPNKPYKCKGNTCKRRGHHSRKFNDLKRRIYNGIRGINN